MIFAQEKGTVQDVLTVLQTFAEVILPDATGIDISHADLLRHLREGIEYAHLLPPTPPRIMLHPLCGTPACRIL